MTFTRRNVWNNGGTFDNPDLLWYAKAVGVMKSRPISDPTSWWFYAAIHREYYKTKPAERFDYLAWQKIKSIPQAMLQAAPSEAQIDRYWTQCTHGNRFFLPWHRGYLAAIEHLLRDIIVNDLKGPADWALPYWNYLNRKEQQDRVPDAFTKEKLILGDTEIDNPLFVPERYTKGFSDLTQKSQGMPSFPNFSAELEDNPHGHAHTDTGGTTPQLGLMSKLETAGLDPIFYLHHANIDRMWAAWNKHGNHNPTDQNWLNSVDNVIAKPFAMPMDSAGTPWFYTSKDVTTTDIKYYKDTVYQFTYDDLSLFSDDKITVPTSQEVLASRLKLLNPDFDALTMIQIPMELNAELAGANSGLLDLTKGTVQTKVTLDPTSWDKVRKTLLSASPNNLPDEVFLQLEGIKGTEEGNKVAVFVNQELVTKFSLFGLETASVPDNHGGAGLTLRANITHIIDKLHLEGNFDVDALDIQLKVEGEIDERGTITVDRIGLYRVKQ